MSQSTAAANTAAYWEQNSVDRVSLSARYRAIRNDSEAICRPLATEDYCIQTVADVSPPKWHLAHVSWFFEAFLLKPFSSNYIEFDTTFDHLFNSYYVTHGNPFPRAQRGLLSRPGVEQIYAYRQHVDQAVLALIEQAPDDCWDALATRLTLGLQHEQQHQELLLTDIKHILAFNPLRPAYRPDLPVTVADAVPMGWLEVPGGVSQIGSSGDNFTFDNETPRHRVSLQDHALATRPVSNGEYLEFIDAGGYSAPEFWLSEGWNTVNRQSWQAPLYWERDGTRWLHMTLSGMRPLDENAPVCHVSLFEADAYCRWAGKRLPTEAEWESAASDQAVAGNLRDAGYLQPMAAAGTSVAGDGGEAAEERRSLRQLFGDVWEWTQSAYGPYPGFQPLAGSLGEYNGKFMCSQVVLRGGSCATPADHIRDSYRNFFYPADRWQFSGIRLAENR